MDISFERPWFLLLIPVVIGLLIFSMRYMIAQNKKTQIGQVVYFGYGAYFSTGTGVG